MNLSLQSAISRGVVAAPGIQVPYMIGRDRDHLQQIPTALQTQPIADVSYWP